MHTGRQLAPRVLIFILEIKLNQNLVRSLYGSIKGIEPTTLPPCKDVLIQQMAAKPFPLQGLAPLDYGWTLSSNFLTVK